MIVWIASVFHVSFMWYSPLVVRDGIVQNFFALTSPGTLYFFSTCPDSQSITHKVSPPHVATVRDPSLISNRLKAMADVSDQYIQAYSTADFIWLNDWQRSPPALHSCEGSKAQAQSCVLKSSGLSCRLWHCRTWDGCRLTGSWNGRGERRTLTMR